MQSARDVTLLDIEEFGPDQRLEVCVEPQGLHFSLSSADVCERQQLAKMAFRNQARFVGSFSSPDQCQERAAEEATALWQAMLLWDLVWLVKPVVDALATGRFLLLVPGNLPLLHFSFRSALRAGIERGLIDLAVIERITTVPLWAGSGCEELFHLAEHDALPPVVAEHTCILLAPAPPGPEEQVLQLLESFGPEETESILGEGNLGLVNRSNELALVRLLQDRATRAGVCIVRDLTSHDLIEHLVAGGEGRTLFLVAHQNDQGVHLHDGVLSMEELRLLLLQQRERGTIPCASVDLAVCDAGLQGNLADQVQALGSLVVLTHGRRARHGAALASLISQLEVLSGSRRLSLPELNDCGWMRAFLLAKKRQPVIEADDNC